VAGPVLVEADDGAVVEVAEAGGGVHEVERLGRPIWRAGLRRGDMACGAYNGVENGARDAR
jgi:hypothetical protein